MNYEALLNDADAEGLNIKERPFRTYDGRIKGKDIYLRKNMDSTEKVCVLAEELGHHHTSVGNILDMTDIGNRKQERQARMWGYDKLIGLRRLIEAYEHGCHDRYDLAEHLEVTDEYLQECIECYREKYGTCVTVDDYYIMFIPSLQVGKIL